MKTVEDHVAAIQAIWLSVYDYDEKSRAVKEYLNAEQLPVNTLYKMWLELDYLLKLCESGRRKYKPTDIKALKTIVRKKLLEK